MKPNIVDRMNPDNNPIRSPASLFPVRNVIKTVPIPKNTMGRKARKSGGFSRIARVRAIGKYPNEGYSRKFFPLSRGIKWLEVTAISRAIPATLGESGLVSSQFQIRSICRDSVKIGRINHVRGHFLANSFKMTSGRRLYGLDMSEKDLVPI